MMGVTDLLGAGGPNLEVEPPFLVSVFLAWQVTLYLHAQKSVFWGDTLPSIGHLTVCRLNVITGLYNMYIGWNYASTDTERAVSPTPGGNLSVQRQT